MALVHTQNYLQCFRVIAILGGMCLARLAPLRARIPSDWYLLQLPEDDTDAVTSSNLVLIGLVHPKDYLQCFRVIAILVGMCLARLAPLRAHIQNYLQRFRVVAISCIQ
jgi:hypothetical protein